MAKRKRTNSNMNMNSVLGFPSPTPYIPVKSSEKILLDAIDGTEHERCELNIPPAILLCKTMDEVNQMRQMFMHLYDKGVISKKTLLATFLLSYETEESNISHEEGQDPQD